MPKKFRGAWEDYFASVLSKHRKLDQIEEMSFEMTFYAGAFVFVEIMQAADDSRTVARDLSKEITTFMVRIRQRAAELGVTLPSRTKH